METFKRSVFIGRSPAAVFAWHRRAGAFSRLAPPWSPVEITGGTGGITTGATLELRTKAGPFWQAWKVEHRDYREGVSFRDVQVSGPFAAWEHVHRFEPAENGGCRLVDEISYRPPFGAAGRLFGGGFVRGELERVFSYRHAVTKADLEAEKGYISVRPMRFLVAGGSGLVGRTLVPFLTTQGHEVIRLVRQAAKAPDEIEWNPAKGEIPAAALRAVDGVINLSGENVGEGRWTEARKRAILTSRIDATRTLVNGMRGMARGRPFVFLSGSATGVYGDRGDELLDERSAAGAGFLAGVCEAWENEARAAEELGVRVVRLRTGVVLTPGGGALAKLLPVFRAGLGGRLGSGQGWMPWITAEDWAGAAYHAILDQRCEGAVNLVAPQTVTNATFTRTLARVLSRPAFLSVPSPALRLALGEMANEMLLASTRVAPTKLEAAGYAFRHGNLEGALRHVLGRE